MGTYGDLMRLNDNEKAQKPKQPSSPTPRIKTPPETEGGNLASMTAIKQSSKQTSMLSSYHDSIVELIRKAVRLYGKEAFFGRFTPEEKRDLSDIAYNYERAGTKTSENQIARIAVNFIVNDYKENGKRSILDKVLNALNK
jgi:hypothetical protein